RTGVKPGDPNINQPQRARSTTKDSLRVLGAAVVFAHFLHRTVRAGHLCSVSLKRERMNPPRRFAMSQWDVFSSKPLEGNSLAVFPDARGLSDADMQAIAKEMNLSETTFVLRRDPDVEGDRGVRVRIFTVQEELPFAGHPTLGTAFALRGRSS